MGSCYRECTLQFIKHLKVASSINSFLSGRIGIMNHCASPAISEHSSSLYWSMPLFWHPSLEM